MTTTTYEPQHRADDPVDSESQALPPYRWFAGRLHADWFAKYGGILTDDERALLWKLRQRKPVSA